jgi:hypothetical protein
VFLIYEKQGYSNVSGPDTCKLMADSLAGFFKQSGIIYNSYDTSLNAAEGFKENLKRELQYTYSSECKHGVLMLLCMVYWCMCLYVCVCVGGGGGIKHRFLKHCSG